MFDAGQYLESLNRPEFIDRDGKRHTGIIIGADTYNGLHAYMREHSFNEDGTLNRTGFQRAQWRIVNAFFPPPPKWKFWEKSVAWHVFQLPEDGRTKAIWDFMQSLAKALGRTLAPLPMGTLMQRAIAAKEAVLPAASPTSGLSPVSIVDTPVSTTPVADVPGTPTTAPSLIGST